MSRFSGWSEAAVKKLSTNKMTNYANKNALKICKQFPDYVGIMEQYIESSLKVECVREYKFLADRRFRFDLAIPKMQIAIEFEGGVWSNGRHVRGRGYVNDVKKYNLATMHGWKLLRYTVEDTKKDNWELSVVEEVRKLIKQGKMDNTKLIPTGIER